MWTWNKPLNASRFLNKGMHTARPTIECLESRRLLSAGPLVGSAELAADGMLEVIGTRKNDAIHVALNAVDATKLDITLNGQAHTFDLTAVAGVRIDGGRGRDNLQVDNANGPVNVPVTLLGGKGNDRLSGGAGDDTVDGGDGKDSLAGGAGADQLLGGKGNDVLDGEEGEDNIDGGAGKDALDGGEGDDELDGGQGRDRVHGRGGRDTFHADDSETELHDRDEATDDDDELVSLDDVPPAVLEAFAMRFGGLIPTKVEAEQSDDGTAVRYEFKWVEDGRKWKAELDSTGDVVEARVAEAHVPAEVLAAFQAAFPGAIIDTVKMERTADGQMEYDFGFTAADGTADEAELGADGQPLESSEGEHEQSDSDRTDDADSTDNDNTDGSDAPDGDGGNHEVDPVPAVVQAAFEAAFPGVTVTEIEVKEESGAMTYEFEFTAADGTRAEAEFNAAGRMID